MAIPFLNNIIVDDAGHIQFKTAAGANAGKIDQSGDDLVLSNAVGDIIIGNGSDDVYIGDGTNAVDIRFEQNMAIYADSASTRTLTLGGANTSLVLESPTINGSLTLGATTINNKLTFTTTNGYILFDYEPSGDTGEYTTEVPLLKVDLNGSESTILARVSEYRAVVLGVDDTVWLRAGDTGSVIKTNVSLSAEQVLMSAEGGFIAYGFPGNDTTWSNRVEFQFRTDSTTASDNGLYIGDGGRTQFIDLDRNLKNIGTISSGVITANSAGSDTVASFVSTDDRARILIQDNNDISYFGTLNGMTFMGTVDTTHANNLNLTSGGYLGIGTTNPDEKLHVMYAHADGTATTYAKAVIEDTDAQLDLLSTSDGTWGSSINLVEAAGSGANTDVWSIARKTTGGNGDSSLNFNFGTNNQHDNTNRVTFSSTGNATFSGNVTVTGGTLYLGNDVSLFDDGTNILRTDDILHANNSIHVGGDGKIYDRANTNNFIELADTINLSTNTSVTGNITLSSNSNVVAARKFVGRDGNGVMLTADDATSGLSIADNGSATFTSDITAGPTATTGGRILSQKYTSADRLGVISSHASSGNLLIGYGAEGKTSASGDFVSTYGNFSGGHSALSISGTQLIWYSEASNSTTAVGSDLTLANVFSVDRSGNVALSGTVDGVDIATRDGVLTSTTTTANAALPKAGGTMSGDIAMGNNDITGVKFIQANGNVDIRTGSGEYALHATQDGQTSLYHNGTKKFETTSVGIDVTGEVQGDSLDIDGNADISGTLVVSGADAITIPDYILHAGDDSKFGFPSNDNFKIRLAGSDVFTMSTTKATLDLSTNTSGSSTGTTFLELANDVGGDISQQQTFIDFKFTDDNANFTPQVRIGAQVGPDADANAISKEGAGSFVVYTAPVGSDESGGSSGLAESMRVSYNGNVTIAGSVTANGTVLTGAPDLSSYAPLASPTFTGTPAAPTAAAGTNTTQLATTAFVSTAVSNLVDTAPDALNTLNELAAALGDDANFSTTVTNSIATKLPLAGGTLTGSLTIGDGTADTRLIIKRVDGDVADDIQFFNGTTRVGEIGTKDTTWLRINQTTAKNIYTPRYIRADAGFFVDGTSKGINGSGNFIGGTIAGASDYGTLLRSDAADTATGKITLEGNSADWNTTTPGTTTGSLHFDPGVGTDHFGNAITFGASDSSNGTTAQAGIYLRTDGSYGSKMYFATTDNYSQGSKVAMYIDKNKDVYFLDDIDVAGNIVVTGTVDGVDIAALAAANTGTNTGDQVSSDFNHDDLTGFVANEHIDWTAENAGTIHASNYTNTVDMGSGFIVANNGGDNQFTIVEDNALRFAGTGATTVSFNSTTKKVTIDSPAETYTAHENISAASSVDNSGNTFIQDITLDSNGHVTFITSAGVSIPEHDNLTGYVANEHIDWTTDASTDIHANNIPDLSGTYLTSIDITADTSPALGADLNMAGFSMYEDAENSYSIDLKDHSSYTWLRNVPGQWSFQSGTSGDDWTQSWQIYVPNVNSDGTNDNVVELGQRHTNDTNGEFKGIRIVKRTSSGVVDGFLQAGDMYAVSGIAIGDLSDTTLTRHSAGHLQLPSNVRIFSDNYHPNADSLTTSRTIAGTSFDGTANIDISYDNLTDKPTIPTNNNQLTNGAGYITSFDITTQTDPKYIRSNADDTVSAHTEWQDSKQARFGNDSDLYIQHTGSEGQIFNSTGQLDIRSSTRILLTSSAGENMAKFHNDGAVELYYNNSQKFATSSSGVSVTGIVQASGNIGNKGTNIGQVLEYGTSSVATLRFDSDRWRIYSGGSGGAGERFSVLETGNVGVGDSTPSYKLDVAGTIRATGDVIAYSDERVKENIKTIDNSLEKVNKLRGVEFNKIGEDKKSIGVIAQEIEKILPEVVRTDDEGMKSVAYGNVVGVLIEAVKELTKEVEELKKCNKCKNCNCNA